MTDQEFKEALDHQASVTEQIQIILRENKMSLRATLNSKIWLVDDGRNTSITGYLIQDRSTK